MLPNLEFGRRLDALAERSERIITLSQILAGLAERQRSEIRQLRAELATQSDGLLYSPSATVASPPDTITAAMLGPSGLRQ